MNLQEYYQANGYVVVRQLIPIELVDRLITIYQRDILPSKHPFFRQNTNRYEPNEINEFGYVKQAFLDIHDYNNFSEFSTSAKKLFCAPELHQALKEITGSSACNLMQTMLFDSNTATTPHQDCWYLDSVPNGHLIGAWIALEDIEEEAGRFFVIPKTTEIDLHSDTPDLPHDQWLERMRNYVDENSERVFAPALRAGDVLFWNSRTIHGALPNINPRYSRKSLTGHYLPSEYAFGNLFVQKDYIQYQDFNGIKYYRNQPDYSLLNKLKFKVKTSVYNSPTALKMMREIQSILVKKH